MLIFHGDVLEKYTRPLWVSGQAFCVSYGWGGGHAMGQRALGLLRGRQTGMKSLALSYAIWGHLFNHSLVSVSSLGYNKSYGAS